MPTGEPPSSPPPGAAMMSLLFRSGRWINRRVEAIDLLESGETRRSVSIDLTLHEELPLIRSSSGLVIPLGVFSKRSFRKLDMLGPTGESLCVLNTNQRAAISTSMLVRMARNVLPDMSAGDHAWLEERLYALTAGSTKHARDTASEISTRLQNFATADNTRPVETFLDVTEAFVGNFILMVDLPENFLGERVLLKYSYESPIERGEISGVWSQGWKKAPSSMILKYLGAPTYELSMGGPQLWLGQSCHLEVRTPPGVQIGEVVVTEISTANTWRDPEDDSAPSPGHVGHVACRPTRHLSEARTTFTVEPDLDALSKAALVASAAAALAFCLPVVFAILQSGWGWDVFGDDVSESATSLLLIGPAALMSYFARSSEHKIIAAVLWPLRRSILYTIFLLMIGAALLTTGFAPPWPDGTNWAILLGLELAICLQVQRFRSRAADLQASRGDRRPRMHRVTSFVRPVEGVPILRSGSPTETTDPRDRLEDLLDRPPESAVRATE